MNYEIEYTNEFEKWWMKLSAGEQDEIASVVTLLGELGPNLRFPRSSGIKGSKYRHMRELRIQYAGDPYRVLYAFNPKRAAILLIGGNKAGDQNWYDRYVPIADRLYGDHLRELEAEDQKRRGE